MAFPIGGVQVHASALRAWNTNDALALFQPAVERIQGVLVRAATGDTIPTESAAAVRKEAGDIVSARFTAPYTNSPHPDGRAAYAGEALPLAPYSERLNARIAQVTAGVVQSHYLYMRRNLDDDLFTWLQTAVVREQVERVFAPNPFVHYSPAHTWVDPNGYRLSDRIWQTSQRTRDRIDKFLLNRIGRGDSVEHTVRDLERFLLPNRKLVRTRTPYGRDASFDAMRLARTEITRAHAEATFISVRLNPFATGIDWALSSRHPEYDICDELATIGMGGERLRDPYPLEDAPQVVADSHPQCICSNMPAVTQDPGAVRDALRKRMDGGEASPLTPASPRAFLNQLLGAYLAGIAIDWLII